MTGPMLQVALIAGVLIASLLTGPLQIVVRGVMRPQLGPHRTRRWHGPVSAGIAGGMVVAVIATGFSDPAIALGAAVLCLLLLLAVIDWQWRWLPLEWTAGLIALALIFGWQGQMLPMVLAQMAVPAVTLLIIRQVMLWVLQKEAMGLGDIWLIAGLGGFLALHQSFLLIGLAALSGLAELLIRQVFQGKTARQRAVSYGTHLCLIFVIMRNFTPIP